MKKLPVILFITLIIIGFSCKKDNGPTTCNYTESSVVAPQSEVNALQAYLAVNGISATKHPSGFFYIILSPGTGTTPTLCSTVGVKYVGQLTNGTVFDQTTTSPASFVLGQLIVGWQKGLPLIQTGGSIRLYIPPTLGYGSTASGPIPANSNLVFDIQLVSVN